MPEEKDPRPFEPLPADAAFGAWRVVAFVPGTRLLLETSRAREARELGRKVTVLLAAAVLGGALLAATWNTHGDFRLVTWPVAGLLGITALFALASIASQLRRTVAGVPLEVSSQPPRVRGVPEAKGSLADYAAPILERELSALRAVVLAVHRDPGGPGSTHRAFARLSLELEGGTSLQGPEAFAPDLAWEDARDRLSSLAAELARVARVPLRVDYRFCNEQFQLEGAELDAPPVSPPSPAVPG